MAASLLFALNVIGPVLMVLVTGYLLMRVNLLTAGFVDVGSKLVFTVTLPALLFLSISQANFQKLADPLLIGIGLGSTLLFFGLLFAVAGILVNPRHARGVVIQGGYRANMGIIGLALCINAFGDKGLALGAVYLGCVTVLFNVLSVYILSHYQPGNVSMVRHLLVLATNPLILSIVVAIPFSYLKIPLPELLVTSTDYLAQLTLPLALLCTGAALEFRSLGADTRNIAVAVIAKCVLYPLIVTGAVYVAGYRGNTLGVVMLMSLAPTAAATYVMAKQLGGDHRLAASIIAISTLVSLPVTALALTLLSDA